MGLGKSNLHVPQKSTAQSWQYGIKRDYQWESNANGWYASTPLYRTWLQQNVQGNNNKLKPYLSRPEEGYDEGAADTL